VPKSRPYPRLATRFTLLFGALAIVIVALVWMAWRAFGDASRYEAARARADEVVTAINEVESATQPLASRAMCAITGGPPLSGEELTAAAWPPVLVRLSRLLVDRPEMLDALGSLRREALLYEQGVVDPLRKACAQEQRLGAAEVQSRLRVAAPQRARVQDAIKRLRNLALEQRLNSARLAGEASSAARRWFAMLALASVLMALSAPIVVRSFSLRLSDLARKLHDESQEREMAREQLLLAQRRMRVVLDHVHDAVVAFDAFGRIQWVNPAAEALFGAERKVLHGCAITQILPGVDDRMRLVNSPEISAGAVIDEHGLSWTSRVLYLDGVRADATERGDERLQLEVSLVQTRVDGQDIGVCIVRPLDQIFDAATAAPVQDDLSMTQPLPDAARFAAATDGRVDLRDCARAAIEACATPAHVRDARVKLAFEPEPLWIDADPYQVQDVLSTLLLKAMDASPHGGEIGVTVLRVGQAARAVVSDAAAGVADLAAIELTGKASDDFDHAYGGNLAHAREVARAMGGAVGFRPGSTPAEQAIWAQWPLA
jgi:NtrC-family two-component system sensor histidine kinase KinB